MGGSATVTATLSGAYGLDVVVELALSGTAILGSDYILSDTSITIPSGSIMGTATMTAVQDALVDPDETIITVTGDTLEVLTVTQAGAATSPVSDIKTNGSNVPVTLGTSEAFSVSISLTARSSLGVDCDWWAMAYTPFGWYYFDASTMSWVYAGDSYTDLSPTYQGLLFDLSTFETLNMSSLPLGTYTFYFAVDTNYKLFIKFW
ncbi:MAG: hypothetical protein ACYSTS_02685 [Planctomycetota bacterium]|jgi:hypothetical protein